MKPIAQRGMGRQLVINSAATTLLYLVTFAVGMWYAPFTVHRLGISMQAIVQVAASFIFYLAFITTGIGASVGRFVMADVTRGDMAAANRTFNTFLVASERVSMVLVLAIGSVVLFVVPYLDYPPGYLAVTRFIFAAILGTSIIQLFNMCFDSAIWVSGRIDIRCGISTVELLVRSGTVLAFFTLLQPSLWHIGAASVIAPTVSLALYYLAWRKLTPDLTIDRKLFDADRFREITGQGGWMLVYQVGTTLQFNADLFLLNVMLGREIQGSYGLLLTWCNMLRGLMGSLSQLLSMSLVAFQSTDDHEEMAKLAIRGIRMQGMLFAIPIGILCGLAGPALNVWVGPQFTFVAPVAWLILVPLALEASFNPVMILVHAPSVISFPAKMAVVLGALNVALAIALVKFTSLGMYGMALSVAITSVVRHGVILPIYAARVIRQPWYAIIQQQAQIIIQLAITGALATYAAQFLHTRSLPQLVLAATAAGTVAALLALLQMTRDERNSLIAIIRRRR